MAKTRISIVKYLNAVPLAWGILEGPQSEHFEPVLSTPAECADQLAAGTVDVGLIPSIEYQRIPGSRILAGPAIASRSRALSVLLLSMVPLVRVRSVAYDQASRASVVLTKVILNEFYRNRPSFQGSEPDPAEMLGRSDAALLIGDVALRYKAEHELPSAEGQKAFIRDGAEPVFTFDLMERWNNLTGLPFVFAFWAARPGFQDQSVTDRLLESREFGLERLDAIADRYAERLGLDRNFLYRYLDRNMDYHMDSDGVEALRLFYSMAMRAGALRSVRTVEFL